MKEKEIIEKIKNNDLQIFETLVDMYSKRLFSVIYRFTNNYDDTEDIMQEVWIKFYKNIKKFKNKSSIYTFLYRIAVNTSINWVNKRKKYYSLYKILPFTAKLFTKSEPIKELINNEIDEKLKKNLDYLPARQKMVFILRVQENKKFKEISQILNITENNAKVTYHTAVNTLKNSLKKEGLL